MMSSRSDWNAFGQAKVVMVRQMCSYVVVETVVLTMSVSAKHSQMAKYKVF